MVFDDCMIGEGRMKPGVQIDQRQKDNKAWLWEGVMKRVMDHQGHARTGINLIRLLAWSGAYWGGQLGLRGGREAIVWIEIPLDADETSLAVTIGGEGTCENNVFYPEDRLPWPIRILYLHRAGIHPSSLLIMTPFIIRRGTCPASASRLRTIRTLF